MSKKKKKMQKSDEPCNLLEKEPVEQLEQSSLNGWNCSATNVFTTATENIDKDTINQDIIEKEELIEEPKTHENKPEMAPTIPETEVVGTEENQDIMETMLVDEHGRIWEQECLDGTVTPAEIKKKLFAKFQHLGKGKKEKRPTEVSTQKTAVKEAKAKHSKKKARTGVLNTVTAKRTPEEEREDFEKFGGLDDIPSEQGKSVLQKMMQNAMFASFAQNATTNLFSLWVWIYTECYYIGVQVFRYCFDLRRLLFQLYIWYKYTIPPILGRLRQMIHRKLDGVTRACLGPFREISQKTRNLGRTLTNKKNEENMVPSDKTKEFGRYVWSLGKPLGKISDFITPIIGCTILALVVIYFGNLTYALQVQYGGHVLGYIEREMDFYEAQAKMKERLISEDFVKLDQGRPSFKLVIVGEESITDIDTLTNKILQNSNSEVVEADGVYIDNAFLGAVEDGSEFLLYVDSILQNYRTGTAHERVQFEKKVEVKRGVYPVSSLRLVHDIKNSIESQETVPQTVIINKGDTLDKIATSFNTTVEDIVALNPNLQARAEIHNLKVPEVIEGEKISVNKVKLSLGIQVTRREVYTEDIDFGTDYTYDNRYPESYVVTISNGRKGEREIIADITYIDGKRISEDRIGQSVTREPVNARKLKGSLKPAQFLPAGSDTSASFIWPVAGGRVTAGLYGYPGHTGMDIAANAGTGVYAARSGTVTYASNTSVWPYGKRIDIDHGGGVMSRYAHNSKVMVQRGQYVTQGQLIALIGRTGNASGNHLHFEIRINGRIMNPADFIGNRYPGNYG